MSLTRKVGKVGMKEYIIELSDDENALSVLLKAYNLHELVRCKDCIHRGNGRKCIVAKISESGTVPYFFLDNHGEWYCADGKRKDSD